MRPFVRREAVLSSKIEGTQATLGELLAAEAGIAVERSPDDLREVGNYVVALEHGMSRLKELPVCVRLIKELHEKLMTGVRGHHSRRGEFRKIQNWMGQPGCAPETASFVPPPPDEVEPCLAAWEKFLHESDLPPLITIALAHYQFEAIHPFLDGNGRVGRLLITMFLMETRILPAPLLYLSAFFEASRRDYYDGLRGVSERGAWQDWIEYFLLGVARMSEDAVNRAGRINAKLAEWQKSVAGESTKTPMRLVELLAANPFITANGGVEKLGMPSPRHNAPLHDWSVLESSSREERRNATAFIARRRCSTSSKNQHSWRPPAIEWIRNLPLCQHSRKCQTPGSLQQIWRIRFRSNDRSLHQIADMGRHRPAAGGRPGGSFAPASSHRPRRLGALSDCGRLRRRARLWRPGRNRNPAPGGGAPEQRPPRRH
jgi:Fic family protein